jgi:serine/threonine protein kinase
MNEKEMLSQINFKNINKLVTTTKDDNTLCLVLELANGIDLVRLFRAFNKLPERLV